MSNFDNLASKAEYYIQKGKFKEGIKEYEQISRDLSEGDQDKIIKIKILERVLEVNMQLTDWGAAYNTTIGLLSYYDKRLDKDKVFLADLNLIRFKWNKEEKAKQIPDYKGYILLLAGLKMQHIKNPSYVLAINNLQVKGHWERKEYSMMLDTMEHSLSISNQLGFKGGLNSIYFHKGLAEYMVGSYDNAIESFKSSIKSYIEGYPQDFTIQSKKMLKKIEDEYSSSKITDIKYNS